MLLTSGSFSSLIYDEMAQDALKIYLAKYREHQKTTGKRVGKKAKLAAAAAAGLAVDDEVSGHGQEDEEEEDNEDEDVDEEY